MTGEDKERSDGHGVDGFAVAGCLLTFGMFLLTVGAAMAIGAWLW